MVRLLNDTGSMPTLNELYDIDNTSRFVSSPSSIGSVSKAVVVQYEMPQVLELGKSRWDGAIEVIVL